MAWNDPDGNERDPWGGRRHDQGPPDLDEVVRKLQERLSRLFGGKPGPQQEGPDNNLVWGVLGVLLVGFLLWDMVYRIDPAERGVVLRFGKYVSILEPGPHVRLPRPFEEVRKINVERIETLTTSSAMLTGDENIVDVEVAVQYRITDAVDYLFKISDPETSVQHIAESAIRDVIGQSKLDFVITEGRAEIATQAQALSQEMLDHYQSGVMITSFNMQPAKPPEEVKAAFDDATKAREDQHRKINEGEAYRNEVVERAAGEGARIRLDAEGYKSRVVSQAEGEAARFTALLAEYEKAPAVTRKRLYMDAMEEVMAGTSKVVTDNKGGSNIVYLPLDKMIGRNATAGDAPAAAEAAPTETAPATYTQQPSAEDALRERRIGRSRVTR
jgi:membrane protease subunit HflK